MADAATQQLIDQIVQEKVQAGEMFTAYDVTLEARRRGGNVRHNDVRDLVHELFEQGRLGAGYNRSLIDVGAPSRPFLYHRFSDDPRNYRSPSTGAPAAVQQPPAAPKQGFVRHLVGKLLGGAAAAPPRASSGPGPGRPAPSGRDSAAAPPRKPVTLGLDAAQFLPISREELASAAKKVRLWGSPWFGRRDLIPPADDDRTKLIDRAMLTNGLLTPEQLAEIHRVGAEMDRLRPDIIATASPGKRGRPGRRRGGAAEEGAAQGRKESRRRRTAEATCRSHRPPPRERHHVSRPRSIRTVGRPRQRRPTIDGPRTAGAQHAGRRGNRPGADHPAIALAGVSHRGRFADALCVLHGAQEKRGHANPERSAPPPGCSPDLDSSEHPGQAADGGAVLMDSWRAAAS